MALTQQKWFDKLKSFVPAWVLEESDGVAEAYFQALAKALNQIQTEVESQIDQTFIDDAASSYLDLLGYERGIERAEGESDNDYRERVRTILNTTSLATLQAAVDAVLNNGTSTFIENLHYETGFHDDEMICDDATCPVIDHTKTYNWISILIPQQDDGTDLEAVCEAIVEVMEKNKALGVTYDVRVETQTTLVRENAYPVVYEDDSEPIYIDWLPGDDNEPTGDDEEEPPPPPPPWAPTDIPGALLILESWKTATITESAGAVSQWTSQDPLAVLCTQSTASRKPSVVASQTPNGQQVIRFGSDDVLQIGGGTKALFDRTRAHTVLAVLRKNSNSPVGNFILNAHDDSGLTPPGIFYRVATTIFEWDGNSARWAPAQWTQSWDSTTFRKLQWEYNGSGSTTLSNIEMKYDGVTLTRVTSGGGNGTKSVIANYDDPPDTNYAGNFDLAALYVYDHVLTTDEMTEMNAYLLEQIGV